MPTSFIFVELDTKKCDSKPSSSSSTVSWITAVSVEGAFLVAATAAIVMLVRKLRVKRTKEGTRYKSATYNLLMISGEHREGAVLRTASKQRCRICILRTNSNVRVTLC